MSWRKRIKGGFESIGGIEHRGEKVQSIKNNNKYKVPKDYLRESTLNTQNSQNLQKSEGNTTSEVKEQSTPKPTPGQTIPAPEPAGLGAEYSDLWHRAWTLADWIDDPAAAPIADRRAKMPELDLLRDRLAEIEQQAAPMAGPDPETSPAETWHTWETTDTTTRDRTPNTCPAKCKRSGKCYSNAYFEGKPGKVKECEPEACKYMTNERENDER